MKGLQNKVRKIYFKKKRQHNAVCHSNRLGNEIEQEEHFTSTGVLLKLNVIKSSSEMCIIDFWHRETEQTDFKQTVHICNIFYS